MLTDKRSVSSIEQQYSNVWVRVMCVNSLLLRMDLLQVCSYAPAIQASLLFFMVGGWRLFRTDVQALVGEVQYLYHV